MKKFGLLLLFTACFATVAIAGESNKIETKESNGIELESDSTYNFSLSKSCLSFFSLFSTTPERKDSLKTKESELEMMKPLF